MTLGMRAGALVLIVAAAIIVALIGRFAFRLWRLSTAPHSSPSVLDQP